MVVHVGMVVLVMHGSKTCLVRLPNAAASIGCETENGPGAWFAVMAQYVFGLETGQWCFDNYSVRS
jgi:hypothetical protein